MNVPELWECRARPAPSGKPCGHYNTIVTRYNGLEVCARCGCTRKASDDRARQERIEAGTSMRLDRDDL